MALLKLGLAGPFAINLDSILQSAIADGRHRAINSKRQPNFREGLALTEQFEGGAANVIAHKALWLSSNVLGIGKARLTSHNASQLGGYVPGSLRGAFRLSRVLANLWGYQCTNHPPIICDFMNRSTVFLHESINCLV